MSRAWMAATSRSTSSTSSAPQPARSASAPSARRARDRARDLMVSLPFFGCRGIPASRADPPLRAQDAFRRGSPGGPASPPAAGAARIPRTREDPMIRRCLLSLLLVAGVLAAPLDARAPASSARRLRGRAPAAPAAARRGAPRWWWAAIRSSWSPRASAPSRRPSAPPPARARIEAPRRGPVRPQLRRCASSTARAPATCWWGPVLLTVTEADAAGAGIPRAALDQRARGARAPVALQDQGFAARLRDHRRWASSSPCSRPSPRCWSSAW